MLAAGAALVILPWHPWRPFPVRDRSALFVRTAFAWLAVSLTMLLLLPAYQAASRIPFSHAYYGATRHAITVGFISMMIMGMAAKVIPMLGGIAPGALSDLRGPFLLVNIGCFLRVLVQVLTDWTEVAFAIIGVSGTLEVAGLAWWGLGLIRLMRHPDSARDEVRTAPERTPGRIEPGHVVADVLDWFPETLPVFERYGFAPLRQPQLRRAFARHVTVAQVAALRGLRAEELLDSLNAAIAEPHLSIN
jgi:hypothetical protein